MNKKPITPMFFPILIFVMGLITPAQVWPNPGIVVVPSEHDFGDVELGSSSSTIIEVTNQWWGNLSIFSVSFQSGSSADFSFIDPPVSGTVIPPGSSVFFGVTYTPSALGYTSDTIDISWTNGESGTANVVLGGAGVQASPTVTIEEILAFFDESVTIGALEGKGRGKSALVRLFVLRKMIERAGKLIDRGRIRAACRKLLGAYRRCDGMRWPPDFVKGTAVPELASKIQDLRNILGCN